MAVAFSCPRCHELNAVKRTECFKCGAKLPVNGRGRPFTSIVRHKGKKIKTALGVVSLTEARRLEQEIKEGLRGTGHKVIEVGERALPSWGDVSERYLRRLEAEGRNEVYLRDCRRYLDRMSEYWGYSRSVGEITPRMVEDFRLDLQVPGKISNRKVSKASCDRHLAAGKAAWRHTVDETIPNPFVKVKLYNKDNQITRFLTDEQRRRLLDAAKRISKPLYETLIVALGTGLRKSNVLNLRRDQVDFERGTITVIQKGGREHTVVMSAGVKRTLESIPDNGTPFFWVSPRTGKPYHKDWRRTYLKAKREAGIENFRWHDLRHDHATSVLKVTRDIKTVKNMLGHTDIKTTERYAHVLSETLKNAADLVDPLRRSS